MTSGARFAADPDGVCEAESYARWLLSIATAAAEGAKEDTFLGFGGVQVSKAEAEALRDLASALGLEP